MFISGGERRYSRSDYKKRNEINRKKLKYREAIQSTIDQFINSNKAQMVIDIIQLQYKLEVIMEWQKYGLQVIKTPKENEYFEVRLRKKRNKFRTMNKYYTF